MLTLLGWSLALSLIINGVLFLIAFKYRSDKLTDASYAISFIALAVYAYYQSPRTGYLVGGIVLVCLWAVRIGSFLLYRVMRAGSDRRFNGIRGRFWRFGSFWLGQAVTVWLLMLPIALLAHGSHAWQNLAFIGLAVWLAGFVLETVADLQKYRHTHNPATKQRWIERGVWRYSRHPNYFGEIAVWTGIYLYAAPALSWGDRFIGVISPIFIFILLRFVSGIPPLEKNSDKRWGHDAAYKTYKQRTNLLVPFFRKKSR